MKMRLGIPATTVFVRGKRWNILQFSVACNKYAARVGVPYDAVLEQMREDPDLISDAPEFQNPSDHKPQHLIQKKQNPGAN